MKNQKLKDHKLVYQRYVLLACNLIKGAVNDWHLREVLKKRLPEVREKAKRRKIRNQIGDLREAREFIMSDGLDKLIEMFSLPLNPWHVRERALMIVRGRMPKRIKTINPMRRKRTGEKA